MTSFKSIYREVFQTFGYPLSERTSLSSGELAKAEKRLGVRVPAALRDYYLVAGRERRFNESCNRLLPPSEWGVDKQRLIFMEENQWVCCWGVSVRNPSSDDPPVSEGYLGDDESITWYPLHRKCSVFLTAMLHHQAISDGLPHCFFKDIDTPNISGFHFDKHGWKYYGELKGEEMYSRPNQVLCYSLFPLDLSRRLGWAVFAGAKTKRDLQAIASELGVSVEDFE
jgi:hypothetical protein